jgi:hypothetical protein
MRVRCLCCIVILATGCAHPAAEQNDPMAEETFRLHPIGTVQRKGDRTFLGPRPPQICQPNPHDYSCYGPMTLCTLRQQVPDLALRRGQQMERHDTIANDHCSRIRDTVQRLALRL